VKTTFSIIIPAVNKLKSSCGHKPAFSSAPGWPAAGVCVKAWIACSLLRISRKVARLVSLLTEIIYCCFSGIVYITLKSHATRLLSPVLILSPGPTFEYKLVNNHYEKHFVHRCRCSRHQLGYRIPWLPCGRYHSYIVGHCNYFSYPGSDQKGLRLQSRPPGAERAHRVPSLVVKEFTQIFLKNIFFPVNSNARPLTRQRGRRNCSFFLTFFPDPETPPATTCQNFVLSKMAQGLTSGKKQPNWRLWQRNIRSCCT
jgi:hypothetical protein